MKHATEIIGIIMAVGAVLQMVFQNPVASGTFWIASGIFWTAN